ncbi:hypothetical protein PAPYR_5923 [Paratrimastix pyriformis]|uniref:F-box domain-containing protein n=1 Tax=Paratrimastix pyriformis TaxID=342808 RepID=A0ABQ8UNR9_9EUKA|nr:hypothetical protein PAPYR_5923 [Paratrimastix pyriformis]
MNTQSAASSSVLELSEERCNLHRLPDDLLCYIGHVTTSLRVYSILISVCHKWRDLIRGTPQAIDLDDDRDCSPRGSADDGIQDDPDLFCFPRLPDVNQLAALIGPCRNLASLSFHPTHALRGCPPSLDWVDAAFPEPCAITTLVVPQCRGLSDSALAKIVSRLPRLEILRLGEAEQPRWACPVGPQVIHAAACHCPRLHTLVVCRIAHTWRLAQGGLHSSLRHLRLPDFHPGEALPPGLEVLSTSRVPLTPLLNIRSLALTDPGALSSALGPFPRLEEIVLNVDPITTLSALRALLNPANDLRAVHLTASHTSTGPLWPLVKTAVLAECRLAALEAVTLDLHATSFEDLGLFAPLLCAPALRRLAIRVQTVNSTGPVTVSGPMLEQFTLESERGLAPSRLEILCPRLTRLRLGCGPTGLSQAPGLLVLDTPRLSRWENLLSAHPLELRGGTATLANLQCLLPQGHHTPTCCRRHLRHVARDRPVIPWFPVLLDLARGSGARLRVLRGLTVVDQADLDVLLTGCPALEALEGLRVQVARPCPQPMVLTAPNLRVLGLAALPPWCHSLAVRASPRLSRLSLAVGPLRELELVDLPSLRALHVDAPECRAVRIGPDCAALEALSLARIASMAPAVLAALLGGLPGLRAVRLHGHRLFPVDVARALTQLPRLVSLHVDRSQQYIRDMPVLSLPAVVDLSLTRFRVPVYRTVLDCPSLETVDLHGNFAMSLEWPAPQPANLTRAVLGPCNNGLYTFVIQIRNISYLRK